MHYIQPDSPVIPVSYPPRPQTWNPYQWPAPRVQLDCPACHFVSEISGPPPLPTFRFCPACGSLVKD